MQKINALWIGDKLSTMEWISLLSHLVVGHEISLWTYSELIVPDGVILRNAAEIIPESEIFYYEVGEGAGSVSAFSNVFRYKTLYEYGNWWCDTDVVCLREFNFEVDYVFASERTREGTDVATTCAMKCPKRCELMEFCYDASISRKTKGLEWGHIGPFLLQEAVNKHNLDKYILPSYAICPVDWFAAEVDPLVHAIPDLMNSHAVHLWHEMWRRANINKNGVYGPCLYEKLKSLILRKFYRRKNKSWDGGNIENFGTT